MQTSTIESKTPQQPEEFKLILTLVKKWNQVKDEEKSEVMAQMMTELKTQFSKSKGDNLKDFDVLIRKIALMLNSVEGEVEDTEDIALRHELEETLWQELGSHEINKLCEYQKKHLKPRFQHELQNIPLEDEIASMQVKDDDDDDDIIDNEEEEDEDDDEEEEGDEEDEEEEHD